LLDATIVSDDRPSHAARYVGGQEGQWEDFYVNISEVEAHQNLIFEVEVSGFGARKTTA